MQLISSTSDAYKAGGIITFMDGDIHVCIQNDSPSFPILQRGLDHATTPGHDWARHGGGGCRREEKKCAE